MRARRGPPNAGCRATADLTRAGYAMVVLENELFRLAALPGKGTDLVELLHKPTDVDLMWWTSLGLRPASPAHADFQSQYEGGWQEVFPSLSPAHVHDGVPLPAYGEAALAAWSFAVVRDDPDEAAVACSLELRALPFRLEKTLRVRRGLAGFELEGRATNLARVPQPADWGQHATFGEPFLAPGSRIELPAPAGGTLVAPARGSAGGFSAHGVEGEGRYRVVRPDGLAAEVTWDAATWPYLWVWRDFGAPAGGPYFGRHYNVGLEPFSSPPAATLEESARRGTALRFEPGETRTTWLRLEVTHER